VTASFGRILSKSLLEHFAPGRRLNVHPSLLPAYRGPAPIQHALLDGLKETGVCVIEMMEYKKGIDVGEIWGQQRVVSYTFKATHLTNVRFQPIHNDAAFPSLRNSLAAEGGQLLVSVLRQMMAGTVCIVIFSTCCRMVYLLVWAMQASATPQRIDDTAKHARMITANDAQLDFRCMTASAILQRHKAISHQVSH
jgi:methionyl-tRNA formyltransferase